MVTFREAQVARKAQYEAELAAIPCYTVFHRWNGNPPIHAVQLAHLHAEMGHARARHQQRIDQDWRGVCLRYPEVLDYYFAMVEYSVPHPDDAMLTDPQFGRPVDQRRLKARRDSITLGGDKAGRRKEKRSGRGVTPPPTMPMLGGYRRP